jgi:serine/threonine-protein kinase
MGNSEPVGTAESFFSVLRKSKLLTAEQLGRARAAHDESSTPQQIAQHLVKRGWITKWQAGQLLAGWCGLVVGKYTLLEQIGKDRLGRLFLAKHTELDRLAQVRTLSRHHCDRPEVVERFLAEARAAAALDHRNIVQVYDVCREGDRHYLVVEHVEGRDLEAIVAERGPLPCEAVANYVAQTANGLAHAHQHGMVHRGLRPAVLLVDDRDVVKIVGLAMGRLNEWTILDGQDGAAAATPDALPYLAPEQIRGDGRVDHLADIYSLGCAMYFLLTGSAPSGPAGVEPGPESGVAPVVLSKRRDAPPELVRICRKMMAARPADRHQSADEVARALGKWLIEQSQSNKPLAAAASSLRQIPSLEQGGAGAPGAANADRQAGSSEDAPRGQAAGAARRMLRRLASPPPMIAVVAAVLLALALAAWIAVRFR